MASSKWSTFIKKIVKIYSYETKPETRGAGETPQQNKLLKLFFFFLKKHLQFFQKKLFLLFRP